MKIFLLSLALLMSAFGFSQMPHNTTIASESKVKDNWPPEIRLVKIETNEYFATQASPGYWVLCPRIAPPIDPRDLVTAPTKDNDPK